MMNILMEYCSIWRTLRHQDKIATGADLFVVSLSMSQHKLHKHRTALSKKKFSPQGSVLQQWMLSAKPHGIGESKTRHLDEFVFDVEASGAVIADVSHGINIANTCALVLQ